MKFKKIKSKNATVKKTEKTLKNKGMVFEKNTQIMYTCPKPY